MLATLRYLLPCSKYDVHGVQIITAPKDHVRGSDLKLDSSEVELMGNVRPMAPDLHRSC